MRCSRRAPRARRRLLSQRAAVGSARSRAAARSSPAPTACARASPQRPALRNERSGGVILHRDDLRTGRQKSATHTRPKGARTAREEEDAVGAEEPDGEDPRHDAQLAPHEQSGVQQEHGHRAPEV
eukprot:7390324-Prymnesium_polylepis.1